MRPDQLRQVIEGILDAVLVLDLDDERVIDVNERACALYGIPREDFAGARLKTVSEVLARWVPRIRENLLAEGFHSFATTRKGRDGEEIALQIHTAIVDTSDHLIVLSVNRDISDDLRMRQQLELAAADWQLTFDAIEECLVVVDEAGVVKRANRSARALAYSVTDALLIGARIDSLSEREPWKRGARLAAYVTAERTPASTQTTDPATQKTWDLSATLIPGGAPHVVLAMKEITDIVGLEASLRRNEQVAEMGHLVGAVAHEVRNPLFAISATFDALEARLDPPDPVIAAHLRNLHEQIDRLSALMHDLLEYGKPPELNITVAPLEAVIDDALSRLSNQVAGDSVSIVNEFPPGLGKILMDHARLSRAVQNLLQNAVHHTAGRGDVRIRGGVAEHSMRTWIWCSIEDAGPGFTGIDSSRVFEPFFSKRLGGTGLGLSIVQRTVEIHGGRIFAENGEGGGGRMTIELPRKGD